MQLILSAPSPSEAAKLVGHILSIITSITLDKLPPGNYTTSFIPFLLGLLEGDFLPGDDELFFFPGDNYPLLNLFLYSYTKSTAC